MVIRKALWLSKEPPTEAMRTLVADRLGYELLHDEQIVELVIDHDTCPSCPTAYVNGLHIVAVNHDAAGVVFMTIPPPLIRVMTDMAYFDATSEVRGPLLRCLVRWKDGVISVGVI